MYVLYLQHKVLFWTLMLTSVLRYSLNVYFIVRWRTFMQIKGKTTMLLSPDVYFLHTNFLQLQTNPLLFVNHVILG